MADRGYNANSLRRDLEAVGTKPIITGRRNRKRPIQHDPIAIARMALPTRRISRTSLARSGTDRL
jgi:IS5 family transposase